MDAVILVLCNVPDCATGEAIARAAVTRGEAACVNLLPGVQSIYRWQGQVEEAQEVTLLFKTAQECYPALERLIRSMHPYQVPEIISLPVGGGLPAYLEWVVKETRKPLDA